MDYDENTSKINENVIHDKIEQTDEINDEDDDEDFVDDEEVDREYDESLDKENKPPIETGSNQAIEYMSKLKPCSTTAISNCGTTLSDSIANDSVSPITKSTHRMSKAMQVKFNKFLERKKMLFRLICTVCKCFIYCKLKESIMTPRSRKPVIIGALRDIAPNNYHNNFMDFQMDDDNRANVSDERFERDISQDQLNASLHRSKSESNLFSKSPVALKSKNSVDEPKAAKSSSDETLSTPFR